MNLFKMADLQEQLQALGEDGKFAGEVSFLQLCRWKEFALWEQGGIENSCFYCDGKDLTCKFYNPRLE